MKYLLFAVLILSLAGCAAGYITHYRYDPNSNEEIKICYGPEFFSDPLSLAEGAQFQVKAVNTAKIEPISYSLLNFMGGIKSDDFDSKGTAFIYFKNSSSQTYRINLKKIVISKEEFPLNITEIVLKPLDNFSTKKITIKVPTYDNGFNLYLYYELDGKPFSQNFPMKRQVIKEFKRIKIK